ncbi:hypothetical protein [Halorussus pelagicus]|uniref:hypothetical protein n=1 Tax=Halorussus pelagicus TaxID=2505977 RepID=UPI001AA03B56|nr:hypothetical protein [Halorussus pelagicus]
MPESTYSVYLVRRNGEQGGKREVTSPVPGHELEFYDTGVWVDRETGRNFFPYEQVRTIREHPEGRDTAHASAAGTETTEGSGGESEPKEEMSED